jgi:hypothetical protein
MVVAHLEEAEKLFARVEAVGKFHSKYHVLPMGASNDILDEMKALAQKIPNVKKLVSREDLVQRELKRRLEGEARHIAMQLKGRRYTPEQTMDLYGVPVEDVKDLLPWLRANKKETANSIDRLFGQTNVESRQIRPSFDIPDVETMAEQVAKNRIETYHLNIGPALEKLTEVGGLIREVRAVPTRTGRAYFDNVTKRLAIGIPEVCFTDETGNMQVDDRELIEIYGHEGMGHALNLLASKASNLPDFLKEISFLNSSTAEAVAQYYQKVLIEDLARDKGLRLRLCIDHNFDRIYQETKDKEKISEYLSRLGHYTTTVLADKSLGDPRDPKTLKKRIERIGEVALEPKYALNVVENNKDQYDSEGNLCYSMVSELRYCARPVDRALKEFERRGIKYSGKGRSIIDRTLLTGLWTPEGFVENAKLAAKSASN